jgi:hypothetical protein
MVLALPAKDARVSESPKKMIRTGREKRRHEAGERLQSSNFFFIPHKRSTASKPNPHVFR